MLVGRSTRMVLASTRYTAAHCRAWIPSSRYSSIHCGAATATVDSSYRFSRAEYATSLSSAHNVAGAAADQCDAATPALSAALDVEPRMLNRPYEVVDTPSKLRAAVDVLGTSKVMGLDVEAFCTDPTVSSMQLGTISLVQASGDTRPVVYIFDVLSLTLPTFVDAVRPLLESDAITKLFFDCRRDVEALSCQMSLRPRGVLDLQLFYAATQWKLRSVNRRSGMTYVLKSVAGVERRELDAAVQTAMTVGNRPVWDTRPLPEHFLEYAADDVRHILLLHHYLVERQCGTSAPPSNRNVFTTCDHAGGDGVSVDAVARLSEQYVEHYAIGHPVQAEADFRPAEVNVHWLERFIGPGGMCHFCGAKGHTETECFKKQNGGAIRCTFCGESGHTARNCFRRFPQLLKCGVCGQLGHVASSCFRKNPCQHCGGLHSTANCHKQNNKNSKRVTV